MDFEGRLDREVDRILADPAFQRAPILRKLLRYLRDETIQADRRSLSQFAIAVDGLGRNEDYDKATESYPRVQISRLRKTLADYYRRKLPGEGFCVFIRRGDYTLHLAPLEEAYPDFRAAGEPNTAFTEPSELLPLSGGIGAGGLTAGLARAMGAIAAIGLILMGATLLFLFLPRTLGDAGNATELPRVALNLDSTNLSGDAPDEAESGKLRLLQKLAGNAIMFSPFSRMGTVGDAEYVFNVKFDVQPSGHVQAYSSFVDEHGRVLSTGAFSFSQDRRTLTNEFNSYLVGILSLRGVLARDLYRKLEGEPKSDLECFVATDSGYTSVTNLQALRRQCLERFPDSPLAAYWYAEAAFVEYIRRVRGGGHVSNSGGAWDDLMKAFKVDQYNVYANLVAAKVELAQGDCEHARYYQDRISTRAPMFPGLQAVVLAEEYPCGQRKGEEREWAGQVERLIDMNENPDQGLKLFLAMDALVVGRKDLARRILSVPDLSGFQSEELTSALQTLDAAMKNVDFARRARTDIEAVMAEYLWSQESRRIILDRLANP